MRRSLRVLLLLLWVGVIAYGLTVDDDRRWLLALFGGLPLLAAFVMLATDRQMPSFPRNVLRVASVLLIFFLLVGLQVVREQVFVSHRLLAGTIVSAHGEVVRNPRDVEEAKRVVRGDFLDRNGATLASIKVAPNGEVQRTYADASVAHVVGFSSWRYGESALEDVYDNFLTGRAGANPLGYLEKTVLHRPITGNDVVLTIDAATQRAAAEAMAGQKGAVVALDPRSGEILALVSAPAFDPNRLVIDPSREDQEAAAAELQAYWESLLNDPERPLFNRALQGLYPPGSTFKTVTAAAALAEGVAREDAPYTCKPEVLINGFRLKSGDFTAPEIHDLAGAYAWSCNTVFAQLGLDLGPKRLSEYAQRFGFGRKISMELPVATSKLSSSAGFLGDPVALATTAFGQGQLQATPLEMALVSATVANKGEMRKPFLVQEIRTRGGTTLKRGETESLRRVLKPEIAAAVTRLMIATVNEGSGKRAALPGIQVAAKTGTAQVPNGGPDAWFIAFAPAENPQVAVAVVVENGGEGSTVAAPIAQAVLAAALQPR